MRVCVWARLVCLHATYRKSQVNCFAFAFCFCFGYISGLVLALVVVVTIISFYWWLAMLLHLLLPLRVFGFVTRTHTAVAAAFCGCKQCCAVVGFVVFPKFCLLTLPLFRQHCSSAHFRVALIFFWVFLLLFVCRFFCHTRTYIRSILLLHVCMSSPRELVI